MRVVSVVKIFVILTMLAISSDVNDVFALPQRASSRGKAWLVPSQ